MCTCNGCEPSVRRGCRSTSSTINGIEQILISDNYINVRLPLKLGYNIGTISINSITDSNNLWTSNNIYLIETSLTITGSLTIKPGTLVYIKSGVSITISTSGGINAQGTKENPIIFKSYDDDYTWLGITMNENSSKYHILKYVRIENSINGLCLNGLINDTNRNKIEEVEIVKSLKYGFKLVGGNIILNKCSSINITGTSFHFESNNQSSCINLFAILYNETLPLYLEEILVTNGGSGYTNAIVTIIGVGSNATAQANITAGSITSIVVTNIGSNYDNSTSLNIIGDGIGADAYLVMKSNRRIVYANNSSPVITKSSFISDQNNISSISLDNNSSLKLENNILYSNGNTTTCIILDSTFSIDNLNMVTNTNILNVYDSTIKQKNASNFWDIVSKDFLTTNPNILANNLSNSDQLLYLKSPTNRGTFIDDNWLKSWSFLANYYNYIITDSSNLDETNKLITYFDINKIQIPIKFLTTNIVHDVFLYFGEVTNNTSITVKLLEGTTNIVSKMVIVNSGINDNSWKSLTITNDSSATTSDSSIFSNFILESNKSYILEIYPTNSSIKVYKKRPVQRPIDIICPSDNMKANKLVFEFD